MKASYAELVEAAVRLLDALDGDDVMVTDDVVRTVVLHLRTLLTPTDPPAVAPNEVLVGTAGAITALTRSQNEAMTGHRVRVTVGSPGATMHGVGRLSRLDLLGAALINDHGRLATWSPVLAIEFAAACGATTPLPFLHSGPCQLAPDHALHPVRVRADRHIDAAGNSWSVTP